MGLPSASSEVGLWLKASVHGQGYGREVVGALVAWAPKAFNVTSFIYAVASENTHSRRIAEALGGCVLGRRSTSKYEPVISVVPAIECSHEARPPVLT